MRFLYCLRWLNVGRLRLICPVIGKALCLTAHNKHMGHGFQVSIPTDHILHTIQSELYPIQANTPLLSPKIKSTEKKQTVNPTNRLPSHLNCLEPHQSDLEHSRHSYIARLSGQRAGQAPWICNCSRVCQRMKKTKKKLCRCYLLEGSCLHKVHARIIGTVACNERTKRGES